MENLQRPLIDRPRYVSNSQNNVNTRSNKVVNKEVPIQENQTQTRRQETQTNKRLQLQLSLNKKK